MFAGYDDGTGAGYAVIGVVMEKAYIYYEGKHFPLTLTDKNANSKVMRNNPYPKIDYSRKEQTDDQ